MRMHKSTLLLVVLFGTSSGLGAEDVLAPGTRLRVTTPLHSENPMVGTLIAEGEDSLSLEVGEQVVSVPRQSVTTLEVSRHRGRRGVGAMIGLATGAIAGAVFGAATYKPCSRNSPRRPRRSRREVGAGSEPTDRPEPRAHARAGCCCPSDDRVWREEQMTIDNHARRSHAMARRLRFRRAAWVWDAVCGTRWRRR
jgi:hypothetical protein